MYIYIVVVALIMGVVVFRTKNNYRIPLKDVQTTRYPLSIRPHEHDYVLLPTRKLQFRKQFRKDIPQKSGPIR